MQMQVQEQNQRSVEGRTEEIKFFEENNVFKKEIKDKIKHAPPLSLSSMALPLS